MKTFIENKKIYSIALGIALCFSGVNYAIQQDLNKAFDNFVSKFSSIESFLNIEDKKNIMAINCFLRSAAMDANLGKLFRMFRIACLKIETLTVQNASRDTDVLVKNAISDIEAEKIKLHVLFFMCQAYKRYKNKNKFNLSNSQISNLIVRTLPNKMQSSSVAKFLRTFTVARFTETSNNLAWIRTLAYQDFYSINPFLSEEYLDLIENHKVLVLRGKNFNIEYFRKQVDDLLGKLFAVNTTNSILDTTCRFISMDTKNNYMDNIIDLLIAKLVIVKNQATILYLQPNFAANDTRQFQLFLQFKILLQSKEFGIVRANKMEHICDLFTNRMQSIFATKDLSQINLSELYDVEAQIKGLLPTQGLMKAVLLTQEQYETVLGKMVTIVDGAINLVLTKNSSDENNALSAGMNVIGQLNDVGFNTVILKDIASAFLNQKFSSMKNAIMFIAAKTGPIWIKKIIPFLPEDVGSLTSLVLNSLVDKIPNTSVV